MSKLNLKQIAMIEELKTNYHNISRACEKVGISRATHYEWINTIGQYKEDSDDIQDGLLDRAEEILMDRLDGSDAALIFFLKTKGKKRGYIEKQEIAMDVEVKNLEISFK